MSHFSLGFFYSSAGQYNKAIAAYEESLHLNPEHRVSLFNIAMVCSHANEAEQSSKWAMLGIPTEERHLRLHPDDENSRMHYAFLLHYCGRSEDACREAIKLKNATDGFILYNAACVLSGSGKKREALEFFRKSIELGFVRDLKQFLTDEDGLVSLAGTPEYEEVLRMVEKLEAEQQTEKAKAL